MWEDSGTQVENPKTAQTVAEWVGGESGRQFTDSELQVQLLLPLVQKGLSTRFTFLSKEAIFPRFTKESAKNTKTESLSETAGPTKETGYNISKIYSNLTDLFIITSFLLFYYVLI
jgi:hypothetical protein